MKVTASGYLLALFYFNLIILNSYKKHWNKFKEKEIVNI